MCFVLAATGLASCWQPAAEVALCCVPLVLSQAGRSVLQRWSGLASGVSMLVHRCSLVCTPGEGEWQAPWD